MHLGDLRVIGVVGFALFMGYLIYGLVIPLTPYSPAGIGDGAGLRLLYTGYSAGVLAGRHCSAISPTVSAIGG